IAKKNLTTVTEFILMGFTDHLQWEVPLFLVFLGFYLVTILGNLGMIILIQVDAHLHTPMYFFLSHLSALDACYTSVITPQILATLARGKMFFFFTICAGTECFLLPVMAYDGYIAISNPLGSLCVWNINFFCDLSPLLELACSNTANAKIIMVCFGNFMVLANALAILRMKSPGGRVKTFSTCASHLTAVAPFFGTLIFMYIWSGSRKSLEEDNIVSVTYTVVISMLNALIYSLRNKDVKAAFRKVTGRFQVSQSMWP
uniref:G-protein coupled receptors family 1 profile domain-containing protein n=1 Tax=Jaculus jaculus TaxID=51337 RepID=A0A8C5L955_JACJA